MNESFLTSNSGYYTNLLLNVLTHRRMTIPYKIHTILTDNGVQFTSSLKEKHVFNEVCLINKIKHKLTKVGHPWTNGQVERMNRTLKKATVKKYYYETHQKLEIHIQQFIAAYNYAKKLKSLNGLTPYEYIISKFNKLPQIFNINPHYHKLGLYI